jgi:hypothetical protein
MFTEGALNVDKLEEGAALDPEEEDRTGPVETARLLLVEMGAEVKARENAGGTPLHAAAAFGHITPKAAAACSDVPPALSRAYTSAPISTSI